MHTPTPWIAKSKEIYRDTPQTTDKLAVMCYRTGNAKQAETDAAYIVRAVNSHEALVEALEDLYIFADGLRQEWQDANPGKDYNPFRLKHLWAAQKALTLAKEGK